MEGSPAQSSSEKQAWKLLLEGTAAREVNRAAARGLCPAVHTKGGSPQVGPLLAHWPDGAGRGYLLGIVNFNTHT